MAIHIDSLSQKIVEKALREGFNEAIAIVHRIDKVMAKIANSELSVVQKWNSIVIDLYLTKDRKIFIVKLEPSSIEEVDRSIKELMAIAGKVAESPFYAPLPTIEKIESLNVVDKAVIEYMSKIDDLVRLVLEVVHRERIDSAAGMVELGYEEKALSTSTSVTASEQKTWLTSYIRAFAGDGSGQWCYTSTKLDTRNLEFMALTAARFAIESRNRVDIEPGHYDVILSPMVVGNLLSYVSGMASAFSVLMGTSIFMKKAIGDRVASEKLCIYDVPRDVELPNATGFDDEAVKTYDKPVIEHGILKTLLHNTKTANIMNAKTTGNAGWISPQPWNIRIAEGDASLDEMVSEVRRGLMITNNWYTRLHNYIEGEFSTIARDAIFLIENGKMTKAVNKVRIADTFSNILNNVDMVGKELHNIQWWEVSMPTKAPYILVRNVRISKHVI